MSTAIAPSPTTTKKITVDAAALAKAIKAIKTNGRQLTGSPVLHALRIDAIRTSVILTRTTIDLTLEATIPGVAPEPVSVILDFALVERALKVFKKGPVTLYVSGEYVSIASGNASVDDQELMPLDEWPALTVTPDRFIELNVDALADVLPSISTDDTRPILAAVLVDQGAYVATDSYRLSLVDTNGSTGGAFLIPRVAATVIARYSGVVRAELDDRNIVVHLGDEAMSVRLTAQLQEGEFPRFRTLIPTGVTTGTTFSDNFAADVKKCISLRATAPETPIRITPCDGEIALLIKSDDRISRVISTGICDVDVAFTPAYLLQILDGMSTRRMLSETSTKPSLLTEPAPQFGEGAVRTRLLMPARIH